MELHGDDLVIADEENNRIQVCPLVSPRSDCITVGGSGGQGSGGLELDGPRHATVDGDGMHVISDTESPGAAPHYAEPDTELHNGCWYGRKRHWTA